MKKDLTTMTLAELMNELKDSVDKYNLSEDGKERLELTMYQEKLVQQYNELSLLTAYGICLKAELPLVHLVKTYDYEVVAIKNNDQKQEVNGIIVSVSVRTITKSSKNFDVVKFIEWAEAGNHTVTASDKWKTAMESAQLFIIDAKKKALAADGKYEISKTKVKNALQKMFDALVFVETAKGNNAIIANKDVANHIIEFSSNRKNSKVNGAVKITGRVLPDSTWRVLLLDILYIATKGKHYAILFGNEPEDDAEAEAPAETEAK